MPRLHFGESFTLTTQQEKPRSSYCGVHCLSADCSWGQLNMHNQGYNVSHVLPLESGWAHCRVVLLLKVTCYTARSLQLKSNLLCYSVSYWENKCIGLLVIPKIVASLLEALAEISATMTDTYPNTEYQTAVWFFIWQEFLWMYCNMCVCVCMYVCMYVCQEIK